jgi:hypothetical protein
MISLLVFLAAATLASGILWRHERLTTYLAAMATLFEIFWLLATLLQRTVLITMPRQSVLLILSVVTLTFWIALYRYYKAPHFSGGSGYKDLPIIIIILLALASAWGITQANGFVNQDWVTHGFFNGDTVTFAALVQRSLTTPTLVTENPFAGNGSLEYPTLVHASFANLLSEARSGLDWFRFIPLLTFIQIIITIPLFFLLWDVSYPEPREAGQRWFGLPKKYYFIWLQSLIVLAVMTFSWDGYVYLQSHFFLAAPFLILVALMVTYLPKRGQQQLPLLLALIIAGLLLGSNAVTGTAAILLIITAGLLRLADRGRIPTERGLSVGVIIVSVILFFVFSPGSAPLEWPNFSYTAAASLYKLTLPLLLLLIGGWLGIGRQFFLSAGATLLCAAAFFLFIFSQRPIITDNASRFLYHALLVGFPLLAAPIIRSFYWLRRELLLSTHTLPELLVGWAAVFVAIALAATGPLSTLIETHDKLLFDDEKKVTFSMQEALWWVEENTVPNAVFLAQPESPWAIPLFTGRSLWRADYWLSPEDEALKDTQLAFKGDKAAQARALAQVQYLWLDAEERVLWEPLDLEKKFDNQSVVIYQVKRSTGLIPQSLLEWGSGALPPRTESHLSAESQPWLSSAGVR